MGITRTHLPAVAQDEGIIEARISARAEPIGRLACGRGKDFPGLPACRLPGTRQVAP